MKLGRSAEESNDVELGRKLGRNYVLQNNYCLQELNTLQKLPTDK